MSPGPLSVVLSHVAAWPEVTRGAERYTHELSWALRERGHRVRILTTTPRAQRYDVLGVPVRGLARGPLPASGPLPARDLATFGARCLADVLPSDVDVWHAGGLYDGAAAAVLGRLRPRLRTVLTLHGPLAPEVVRTGPQRRALALARRVDEVVCVSVAAADQATAELRRQPVVVPPGVDSARFCPGGARSAVPVVLYVGALGSRRKNLALLLEAVAALPRVQLHLVGQGDPGPLLREAPPEVRDRVRVRGPLEGPALVDAYRSAWVTALVSEREVFGMTVVESLACGTPAVVLDDGWGPSGLVAEGTGTRSAPTAAALTTAVRAALDLAGEAGTAERCRAAGVTYDWQAHVAPRIEELYRHG